MFSHFDAFYGGGSPSYALAPCLKGRNHAVPFYVCYIIFIEFYKSFIWFAQEFIG